MLIIEEFADISEPGDLAMIIRSSETPGAIERSDDVAVESYRPPAL